MLSLDISIYWFNILFSISQSLDISFNQPQFNPCASWEVNATTLIGSTALGSSPYDLFIDIDNTIYVNSRKKNNTQVWLEGAGSATNTFSNNFGAPAGIFVTISKDVYIDNGLYQNQVDMWVFNRTTSVSVMNVSGRCHSLFIDQNNTLYCSMGDNNQVVRKSLNASISAMPTIVAGNGSIGSMANLLNKPYGIFVDNNYKLYVADSGNDRIQYFQFDQLNGNTVVGNGSNINFALNGPSDVTLDGNGYLFIVDRNKNRIIGSGPYGYRCIAGCSGISNATADTLSAPFALAFDSHGNLFVLDTGNSRVQKFTLTNDFCVETTTQRTTALLSSSDSKEDSTTVDQTIMQTNEDLITTYSTETKADSIEVTMFTTLFTDQTTTLRTITTTITEFNSISSHKSMTTTMIQSTSPTKSTVSVVLDCSNSNYIGSSCNLINNLCDILNPCQNSGTCYFNISMSDHYFCLCPSGFSGRNCQSDNRPCKVNTCWNSGSCVTLSNTSFSCLCSAGWHGLHCETKINYCGNITCLNNGVCRPLLQDYKCECLAGSFSGRYCEQKSSDVVIKEIVTKTLTYVAIIAIAIVMLFVLILDILKYVFHIDPVHPQCKQLRKRKIHIQQKTPVIIKFNYVN